MSLALGARVVAEENMYAMFSSQWTVVEFMIRVYVKVIDGW